LEASTRRSGNSTAESVTGTSIIQRSVLFQSRFLHYPCFGFSYCIATIVHSVIGFDAWAIGANPRDSYRKRAAVLSARTSTRKLLYPPARPFSIAICMSRLPKPCPLHWDATLIARI